MKVQIIGRRPYLNPKTNKWTTPDVFLNKNWRADSVSELFANLETYIEAIPENERWEIHYTLANCVEGPGRKFAYQSVIAWDIDDVDTTKINEYIPIVCKVLQVEQSSIGIVFSGHGLHFIVGLATPFEENFFDEFKPYYKIISENISLALAKANLAGSVDTGNTFSSGKTLRLPETTNRKSTPEVQAKLLNRAIVPQEYDLKKISGVPYIANDEQLSTQEFRKYGKPDNEAIVKGCEFLKYAYKNQEKIKEPEWFAMISIVSRMDRGYDLCHQFSEKHPSYSKSETDAKINQAMVGSGPRTCKGVNSIWGQCVTCPYWEKISSPITIKSEDYIATADNFFHFAGENGKVGRADYYGLLKAFKKRYDYVINDQSKVIYTWNGKYYEQLDPIYIESFVQEKMQQFASKAKASEFNALVYRNNIVPSTTFDKASFLMNFPNGVLDLETMELLPHDKKYGFRTILPYEYSKDAKSPIFDAMLKRVTCNRTDLENILLEFFGYCLSGMPCYYAKILIMLGETASNGKSTLIKVMQGLAGKDNTCSLTMNDLKDINLRKRFETSFFNLADETPKFMGDSSVLKTLATGGEITVKQMYEQPYEITNRCKLVFSCNRLPKNTDPSDGIYRRLLIVPFDFKFTEDQPDFDPFIDDKLRQELSGILNRVLDGYKRLRLQNQFTKSTTVSKIVSEYKKESSNINMFWDDYKQEITMTKKSDDFIEFQKIYADYMQFCLMYNERPENANVFSREIKLMSHLSTERKKIKGKLATVVTGIKFDNTAMF